MYDFATVLFYVFTPFASWQPIKIKMPISTNHSTNKQTKIQSTNFSKSNNQWIYQRNFTGMVQHPGMFGGAYGRPPGGFYNMPPRMGMPPRMVSIVVIHSVLYEGRARPPLCVSWTIKYFLAIWLVDGLRI